MKCEIIMNPSWNNFDINPVTHDAWLRRDWIWQMPETGLNWCDCGAHHMLTADIIEVVARGLKLHYPMELTYNELFMLTTSVWNYNLVCQGFCIHLDRAVIAVAGAGSERFPWITAIDIVGYFSRTWPGCTEQNCLG